MAHDVRITIALLGVAVLFVAGVAKRWGTWSIRRWAIFGATIALTAVLWWVASRMATAVDSGLTRPWPQAWRSAWAWTLAVLAVGGVTLGMLTLLDFGGAIPLRESAAVFLGTVGPIIGGVAVFRLVGLSFERSYFLSTGILLVGLGGLKPEFLRRKFDRYPGSSPLDTGRKFALLLVIGVVFLLVALLAMT